MTTFHSGEQTHRAVLPQQPALESASADTGQDRGRPPGADHDRTPAPGTTDPRRHGATRRLSPQKAFGESPVPGAPARQPPAAGRLASPSLRHRIDSTMAVVVRLCRYAPVFEIHVEQVAFDTAAFAGVTPSVTKEGVESTYGASEVREFLLAKWKRSCAYCGATGVPLHIDHVRARSRGGSDRVSNLVLACVPCNQAKGTAPVHEFLADRPARLELVIAQLRRPLQDVAATNTTRLGLVKALAAQGVPVHAWSGGRTHWNRLAMGLPKSHTIDALATGVFDHARGDALVRVPAQILVVASTGRGSYARTTPDRFGFPACSGRAARSTTGTRPGTW